MDKKKRKQQLDINEIAFRVVQESTNEDNLCESKKIKTTKSNHPATQK